MRPDRLGDLRADRQHRRERVHRFLEDDADTGAANGTERVVGGADEFLAAEPDAAGDPRFGRQQTEHAHGADGLAGAGLAHEREHASGGQGEGDVTDDGLRVAERDAEPLDLEQRRTHFASETLR